MLEVIGRLLAHQFATQKGSIMKFADLTAAQRSTLAALRSTDRLRTDALGRGCSPQLTAQRSAANLLEMRKLGLVYSVQKPEGQQYAEWAITTFGQAVFDGRPHDVQPDDVAEIVGRSIGIHMAAADAPINAEPTIAERDRCYIISCSTETLQRNAVGTRDHVLAVAQSLAEANQGKSYVVYEQIATVVLAKPVASITLL